MLVEMAVEGGAIPALSAPAGRPTLALAARQVADRGVVNSGDQRRPLDAKLRERDLVQRRLAMAPRRSGCPEYAYLRM
jgi:hypothetical protein